MPILYLLAGPNGSGKTTFYDTAVQQGIIDPTLHFVNVDLITKGLGGYSEENFAHAENIYRSQIAKLIEDKNSFMIESNLAKESDYLWIDNMRKAGYEIILYFLGTEDVDENIARVKRRVKEGGHDVPEHIVRDRYRLSLIYLRTKFGLFKQAYLLDNSGTTVEKAAALQNGKVEYLADKQYAWVESLLYIVKRQKPN
jgi:predicted ABC-type ATPase